MNDETCVLVFDSFAALTPKAQNWDDFKERWAKERFDSTIKSETAFTEELKITPPVTAAQRETHDTWSDYVDSKKELSDVIDIYRMCYLGASFLSFTQDETFPKSSLLINTTPIRRSYDIGHSLFGIVNCVGAFEESGEAQLALFINAKEFKNRFPYATPTMVLTFTEKFLEEPLRPEVRQMVRTTFTETLGPDPAIKPGTSAIPRANLN